MASVAQQPLFGWEQIEALGDLARLKLVVENLPDEPLMAALERQRGKRGRDDYPVRAMWNALLAGVVFQHPSVESLRRELARNGQLRVLCGFWARTKTSLVPDSWVFSRFLAAVMKQADVVQTMFETLVAETRQLLPDYGRDLAVDGKALASYARGHLQESTGKQAPGRRRDTDAQWGVHAHSVVGDDGTAWEKVKRWFGYSLHLIVDTRYELPVAFSLTKANASEVVEAHHLLSHIEEQQPLVLQRCRSFAADRGYDDGKLVRALWDNWQVLPIIDIRNCWHDGEETKVACGCQNVVYDYRGTLSCVCPRSGTQRQMAYGGFERDRGTLKYRCPASHYGLYCAGIDKCPVGQAVRIPIEQERRVFTPLPRSSHKWKRLYAGRTAAERVNSRIDNVFGFENHTIRGQAKMLTRCTLALVVMLAIAVGRIKANEAKHMRSLLRPAA